MLQALLSQLTKQTSLMTRIGALLARLFLHLFIVLSLDALCIDFPFDPLRFELTFGTIPL